MFCESQHRALPSLRRRARDPEVELHPDAAAERGIDAGDWVTIETPDGSVRARARLNETLEPRVVCGQHGWWQACPEIGAPGYDAVQRGWRQPQPDHRQRRRSIRSAVVSPIAPTPAKSF